MVRIRTLMPSACVGALVVALIGTTANAGTYGYDYVPGGSSITAAEIVNRVGEVLAAIDSPQRRSQLAEQWLTFARQFVTKDQEFRAKWLQLQKRQSVQQQEAEQLRLEIAKLQIRIEELRADNLRLEQENLRMQMKLAPQNRQALGDAPPQGRPVPRLRDARAHNPSPDGN